MKISTLFTLSTMAITFSISSLAFAQNNDVPQNLTRMKLPVVTNYNMTVPVLRLNNPTASNKANQTLAHFANEALTNFTKGSFNLEGVFSSEVKYQDNNLISLLITQYNYTGGAHGFHTQVGFVFDKNTGKSLPLSYFLKIKDNQEIIKGLEDHTLGLYAQNMEKLTFSKDFANLGTALPTSYYLAGNGGLYIVYPPYVLSSYNNGSTKVFFSEAAVNKFNKDYASMK